MAAIGELSHGIAGRGRLHRWRGSGNACRVMSHLLLSMTVNGEPVQVAAPAHHTLLEVLRYKLDLIGTKQGCDKGDCGACTVQIDGVPQLACLTLAVHAQDRAVTTVEGLGLQAGGCHPLQDAFDRWNAAQCGFCTPGILMSAEALLRRHRGQALTRAQVCEALAGNLCRCKGYTKIIDAVLDAAGQGAAVAGEVRHAE